MAGKKQIPATAAEQAARIAAGTTQGRAGCKMPRANLTFSEENYAFIRTISKVQGCTMSQLVNGILDEYRSNNPEMYVAAEQFEKAVKMIAAGRLAEDNDNQQDE